MVDAFEQEKNSFPVARFRIYVKFLCRCTAIILQKKFFFAAMTGTYMLDMDRVHEKVLV